MPPTSKPQFLQSNGSQQQMTKETSRPPRLSGAISGSCLWHPQTGLGNALKNQPLVQIKENKIKGQNHNHIRITKLNSSIRIIYSQPDYFPLLEPCRAVIRMLVRPMETGAAPCDISGFLLAWGSNEQVTAKRINLSGSPEMKLHIQQFGLRCFFTVSFL